MSPKSVKPKSNKVLLLEALENGNHEDVVKYAHEAEATFSNVNFAHSNFQSSLLSFIGDKFGDSEVEAALRYVAENTWKDFYSNILGDHDKLLAFWIKNYACADFDIEIDDYDDRTVITIFECKTGGAIIKKNNAFGCSKNKAEWSFNKKDIPYYCSHCKINKEILPREWGFDDFTFNCGVERINNKYLQFPCEMIIYKNRKKEE